MSDAARLASLTDIYRRGIRENRLAVYQPYPWQLEFHNAGKDNPERMLMAANRVGKTRCAAAESAYHLTGDYPDWWNGKRFDYPVLVWSGSPTNETSRDIVQAELIGDLGAGLGTGMVPRAKIIGQPQTRQAGVKNVVESFKVKHRSGGVSVCTLKTYEMGWQKWQGTAPHVVWLDEEPDDYKIFSEAQTRTITSHGVILVTFTPLLGMTDLVDHFMSPPKEIAHRIFVKGATWDDAPHMSDVDKKERAASYRTHEVAARTQGIPMMGRGAIFPISDDRISCDPFPIPDHFARIKGCDFGYEHAAAGAEIAYDRDQDIVYVIDCYKEKEQLAPYHAAWFNKSNRWIPVAWPHDGLNTEKSGGSKIKDAYIEYGVNMLGKSARYAKAKGEDREKGGGQDQWPIIDKIRDRMRTGKFKVFSNLSEWFEEKRSYHTKETNDGGSKIVARRDDILKATFYAVMMLRYAVTQGEITPQRSVASAPIVTSRL
jgi:phage terminase large subunit-like protein